MDNNTHFEHLCENIERNNPPPLKNESDKKLYKKRDTELIVILIRRMNISKKTTDE